MEQSGSKRKRTELIHDKKQVRLPSEPLSLKQLKKNVQESDLEHVVPPAKKRRPGKNSAE